MEKRPNPDQLLARAQADQGQRSRGRLKIFFGASAGVGKTYAMLQAAHEQRSAGVDVLAGYIETHQRAETEALVRDLELLAHQQIDYHGATIEEFDIDAALARRPKLILVDELAHTNAAGARHPKRWQDVEELLDVGIDVYTTVNVQHIESLNDVVAQITGVIVRETVPDRIVEQADEVELIDLTPDDLLQRLRAGKVYLPAQAERALQNFFRKGNLIALRELALRRTADRVDAQMQHYRQNHAIAQTWPTNERLLVGIGPGPTGARLVRAARRMAAAMRAEWIVVAVETPKTTRLPEPEREQLIQTLRLAEQLGAETVTLSGQRASDTMLDYARARNVTKIVIGKPERPRWQELVFGSTVDELVRRSGDIDVYVISAAEEEQRASRLPALERTSGSAAYGWGTLAVISCTALAALMFPYFDEANIIMVYLLGIVAVAIRLGRGPSILASVLSVAAFDFFFAPPFYTFAVSDAQYLITFGIMLLVALVISTLTTRIKRQADAAQERERRASALYALSRDVASTRDIESLLRNAVKHINDVFDSQVVILLPTLRQAQDGPPGARLQPWGRFAGWWPSDDSKRTIFAPDARDQGVAQWVFDHSQIAGQGTDTLPGSEAVFLPLLASRGTVGVLGVRSAQPRRLLSPEQLHLLETFANQIALAIERATLADEAQQAQVLVETERTRNSLLSSVSHDLRTPLATITGASSSLLEAEASFDAATRHELTQTIFDESNRLNRLVGNLLDMTRLESGAITIRKEWQPFEEVLGVALARLDSQLGDRPIGIELPADGALAPFDGLLIEQVLINLLENAIKYTPPASPIDIAGRSSDNMLTISIADYGPGLPPGDAEQIFDKFYRAQSAQAGVGLGLTICRAIVMAHGGRIWAANRPGGGTIFTWTLPLDGKPPQISSE